MDYTFRTMIDKFILNFDVFLKNEVLPEIEKLAAPPLMEPMLYVLSNAGKRIRPYLVFSCAGFSYDAQRYKSAFYVASSLELLHTYSFIHDDLPAMDDDDMRRGKPSCHMQFSEWGAILAGDALNTLAFGLLAKAKEEDDSLDLCQMVSLLNKRGGMEGMVSGQAQDLYAEKVWPHNREKEEAKTLLKEIHQKKTASLFACACEFGALLGGLKDIQKYSEYGWKLGLLFQIKDDLLDVQGDVKDMGKAVGKDIDKLSYPRIYGIEESEKLAMALQRDLEGLSTSLAVPPRADKNYIQDLAKLGNIIFKRNF